MPPERRPERRRDLFRPLLPARLDHEIDVDLELARADRRLDPVAVASRVRKRLRDGRLGRSEEAQHLPTKRRRPLQDPAHDVGLERARPQPAELARRPGQHHHRARAHLEDEPRRSPREPERHRPLGQGRLLADARLELGVRPAQALRHHPRDRAYLLLEPLVDAQLPPGGPGDHLHRAVVVRRAETAGDEAEIGLEPFPERPLEIVGPVADDRDPFRLEPEPKRLRSEKGAVLVLAVPADQLAARDDDRRPRAAHEGAVAILRAVTTNEVPAGSSTRFPFTRTRTFSGFLSASRRPRPVNVFFWPRSSVPLYSGSRVTRAGRTSIHESPAAARTTRFTMRAFDPIAPSAARRVEPGRDLGLGVTELPSGDDERGHDGDRDERKDGDPRLASRPASLLLDRHPPRRG